MKNTIIKSLVLLTIISCSSNETAITPEPPVGPDGLIWSDEFDETGSPSSDNWTYDVGNGTDGWGNNEDQFYTRSNATSEDGILKITAKQETYRGYEYTSSRIKTKGRFTFTYGRVEVRAKLPKGRGTWPAIWMLGDNIDTVSWPECGPQNCQHLLNFKGNCMLSGSGGRDRTYDQLINSQLLYR